MGLEAMATLAMADRRLEMGDSDEAAGAVAIIWNKNDGSSVNINAIGTGFLTWLETKYLDFDDPQRIKSIDYVLPKFTGLGATAGLSLYIYSLERLGGTPVLEDTVTISLDGGPLPVRVMSSPYYKFRFEDASLTTIWKFSGFEVWGEAEGQRF